MKRFIFIGAPGAGKGTQAVLLSEKADISHVSTGEMLRAAVAHGTELGKQVGPIIDAGHLVPDELIVKVLKERISESDCANGYILDGFPRTIAQAEELIEVMTERGEELTAVVLFDVSAEELKRRLANRRKAESRDDDSKEIFERRLQVYQEQTEPLVKFYQDLGLLVRIDASGSVEEIHSRVAELVAV